MRANGGNVLHFPWARFVAIGAAGERADRTDVDAHAALFALEMIFAVGDNYAVGAAHAHTERFDVHAFVANPDAAEAENAARGVVVNELGPFFFRAVNFFLDEAAGISPSAENHALQCALCALGPHRRRP